MLASKGHRKVGSILFSSVFSHYRIFEEYPVVEVNPHYNNGQHRFDWVILDLKLVIEVHGEQHYKVCTFGGVSIEQGIENLQTQQLRDERKKRAAEDAGWIYLSIPYWKLKDITAQDIINHYHKMVKDSGPIDEVAELTFQERIKEKQKEYKRQAYRRWKCRKE